jgi:salicylate hydroxylase
MSDPKRFKVAIIGGGIAGLTLAISLRNRGIPVTIYEQAARFGEIGAGVSFTPNAIEAMDICGPGVYAAYDKVATRNAWDAKKDIWFDYLDGTIKEPGVEGGKHQKPEFVIRNRIGQNGVHRAHFLDELVKLVPRDIAVFGKRLVGIDDGAQGGGVGKLVMRFEDGTMAEADAVVGCDGIKSRVRSAMFGADHPATRPVYSHKYAYRALVPIDQAIEVLGEENAMNACMHVSLALAAFRKRRGNIPG